MPKDCGESLHSPDLWQYRSPNEWGHISMVISMPFCFENLRYDDRVHSMTATPLSEHNSKGRNFQVLEVSKARKVRNRVHEKKKKRKNLDAKETKCNNKPNLKICQILLLLLLLLIERGNKEMIIIMIKEMMIIMIRDDDNNNNKGDEKIR
ncbi:hypothetical protein L873DRAFT_183967 [Choiromyces venosus 120613-1]|uniref:Uncharacterized protein n=1 Tax=Choiromyces venosus 120613-1 TaxID=1336337 RepID=A0A3N4J7C6_9PEZI|nr:hypothetical protein L873DRAFT_183967 [Choiromyces venosus 120613-1]